MYSVFLDTNVFQSAHFSYKNNHLEKLLKKSKSGEVKRRINHEISKHFHFNGKETAHYLRNLFNTPQTSKGSARYIEEKRTSDFEELITNDELLIMPSIDIPLDEIAEMYNNGLPPFEHAGDKKSFPDSIICKSIESYFTSKDTLVITNDMAIQNYLDKNGIKYFTFVRECLNHLHKKSDFIEANKDYIVRKIELGISKDAVIEFLLNGYAFEEYGVEINIVDEIKFAAESIEVVDYGEDSITISFECEITIDLETDTFRDFDYAVHDTEDDVWYTFSSKRFRFTRVENISIDVELEIIEDDNFDITFITRDIKLEIDLDSIYDDKNNSNIQCIYNHDD